MKQTSRPGGISCLSFGISPYHKGFGPPSWQTTPLREKRHNSSRVSSLTMTRDMPSTFTQLSRKQEEEKKRRPARVPPAPMEPQGRARKGPGKHAAGPARTEGPAGQRAAPQQKNSSLRFWPSEVQVEEWRSGGVEEWRSGGVEEWRSGGVEEWRSGGVQELK